MLPSRSRTTKKHVLKIASNVSFRHDYSIASQDILGISNLVEECMIVGSPDTIGRKMLEQAMFRLCIKKPLRR